MFCYSLAVMKSGTQGTGGQPMFADDWYIVIVGCESYSLVQSMTHKCIELTPVPMVFNPSSWPLGIACIYILAHIVHED